MKIINSIILLDIENRTDDLRIFIMECRDHD